ncbi:hypothetical protein BFO01nite_40750 [Brevibacillus formosus]|uniref:Uncharacterized protein n=1 Tax=Brevibacillus formosus TaxID=54913 RepID=A0ABQ0T9E8_9BACL|nr:hypothetical protein BFO01nite_40750 [Brevibacillus formosus]
MVTLALTSGLRRGIEWLHINWETGAIDVVQSVTISPAGIVHMKETENKEPSVKYHSPSQW